MADEPVLQSINPTDDPPAPTPAPEPEPTPVEPSPELPKAPEPKPPSPDQWKVDAQQKRIDKLTAKLRDAEAALAAKQSTGVATPTDEAEFQRRVDERANALAQERAQQIAQAQSFEQRANQLVESGRETYGAEKFNERVAALRQLYDPKDPEVNRRYLDMLDAIMETGEGAKIIYTLGEDVNEASRIMGLSPVKQGLALAKLATATPSDVSKAPKPITAIQSRGPSHDRITAEEPERADRLSISEWMDRRNSHVDGLNKSAGRRVL